MEPGGKGECICFWYIVYMPLRLRLVVLNTLRNVLHMHIQQLLDSPVTPPGVTPELFTALQFI